MSSKTKTIAKVESLVLLILTVSMLPSLFIALFNNEKSCAMAFFMIILIIGSLSTITGIRFRHSRYNFKNRDGFLIVSITYLLTIVVGALPFWVSENTVSFIDAFFESASGFTTTGASIFTDVEAVPLSLIYWRSFSQWLGGMGILVFFTAIAPAFALDGETIADPETIGPTHNKLTSHFSNYSVQIYVIYIALTFIEIILLKLVGVSIFDSFIHTFSTVSTGGFSSYGSTIGLFDNVFVMIITMAFMFISATNINLYFLAKKRGIKEVLKEEETRFYCSVIVVASLLIAICNIVFNSFKDIGNTILDSFFQVVSIVSTTGYASADYSMWPTFSKFVLLFLFFIGGCASSTAGGIKCVRIYGGLKLILRGIYSRIHPNIISPVTFNGKEMSNDMAIRISNFIFTYIAIIAFGTLALSINGYDFMTNFSAATSCLGNVGMGFNIVGPTMSFAVFSDFSKLVCAFLMITGRVELYAILVLFSRNYWNPNKLR